MKQTRLSVSDRGQEPSLTKSEPLLQDLLRFFFQFVCSGADVAFEYELGWTKAAYLSSLCTHKSKPNFSC